MTPIHLRPTAELAERVLLPGDPGRALFLAQSLLDPPRMFNHHRGLWGYSGVAADGELLTIQSTGMGGPSAAIVISELIDIGARRMIRVGTCGALADGLNLGALLVAEAALCADGTSAALSEVETASLSRALPTPALYDALVEAAHGEQLVEAGGGAAEIGSARGPIVSTDLFYDPRGLEGAWREAGLLAVEMESATLFALAGRHGAQAASLLIVSDQLHPERRRIDPEALREAEGRAGRVALRALARPGFPRPSPRRLP